MSADVYARLVAHVYPLIAAAHEWFVGERRSRLLTRAFALPAGDDPVAAIRPTESGARPSPTPPRPLVVVEIGPGSGTNLRFLPQKTIWVGIEPNRHMHRRLQRRARVHGVRAEIRDSSAESLDLPDATADAVIGTFVLCCTQRPQLAVSEIHRVLKPQGRYFFLEHVAAPADTPLGRWQRRLRPVWRALTDGCQIDHNTEAHICSAGFGRLDYDRFELALPPPLHLIAPHISGLAVK
jgi:SAM-dependent methyltransferase